MYKKTEKCRICGNKHLECVLDLGEQMLTGVFPRKKGAKVTAGPLRLVKCVGGDKVCGLLQLEHSYDLAEMYGVNYGYRSGLNASMVAHLNDKVKKILGLVTLKKGDLVVDIGSNDSTTLQAYPVPGPVLVGIDPTGVKFHKYYPSHIQLIPDFFSSALLKNKFPGQKAYKLLTDGALGEFDVTMLIRQHVGKAEAEKIGTHWRGGRLSVWEGKTDKHPILAHVVEFDSEESAKQYFEAYKVVLTKKSKGYREDSSDAINRVVGTTAAGRFELLLRGQTVSSLEGIR